MEEVQNASGLLFLLQQTKTDIIYLKNTSLIKILNLHSYHNDHNLLE